MHFFKSGSSPPAYLSRLLSYKLRGLKSPKTLQSGDHNYIQNHAGLYKGMFIGL